MAFVSVTSIAPANVLVAVELAQKYTASTYVLDEIAPTASSPPSNVVVPVPVKALFAESSGRPSSLGVSQLKLSPVESKVSMSLFAAVLSASRSSSTMTPLEMATAPALVTLTSPEKSLPPRSPRVEVA